MSGVRMELQNFLDRLDQGIWVSPWKSKGILQRKYGNQVAPGLIGCLVDESVDIRLKSLEILACGEKLDQEFLLPLCRCLKDPDFRVGYSAMLLLQQFGEWAKEAVSDILPFLNALSETARVNAAVALVCLDSSWKKLVPSILEKLNHEDFVVRECVQEFCFSKYGDWGTFRS